jgi:hypothetical protein
MSCVDVFCNVVLLPFMPIDATLHNLQLFLQHSVYTASLYYILVFLSYNKSQISKLFQLKHYCLGHFTSSWIFLYLQVFVNCIFFRHQV